MCLLLWGVFTFGLWISTFRLSRLLFLIFLTLWIAFFLLGGGAVFANPTLHMLGGWVGLLCGGLWPCMAASPWSPTPPMAGKSPRSAAANERRSGLFPGVIAAAA